MNKIWIRVGKAKALWDGNPQIFQKIISRVEETSSDPNLVEVWDSKIKSQIGKALLDPRGFPPYWIFAKADEEINRFFFKKRIRNALSCRKNLFKKGQHDSFCLINGVGDAFPGLFVQLYGNVIGVKWLFPFYEDHILDITSILKEEIRGLIGEEITCIYNQTDFDIQKLPRIFFHGELTDEAITLHQDSHAFLFYPMDREKNAFYSDQRTNRLFVRHFLEGRSKLKILDACAGSAAFSIYLSDLKKSDIKSLDISPAISKIAGKNLELNKISSVDIVEDDVVSFLKSNFAYDLILLDPPSFVKQGREKEQALKKHINLIYSAILSLKEGAFLAYSLRGTYFASKDFRYCVTEAFKQAQKSCKWLYYSAFPEIQAPVHQELSDYSDLKFAFLQVF